METVKDANHAKDTSDCVIPNSTQRREAAKVRRLEFVGAHAASPRLGTFSFGPRSAICRGSSMSAQSPVRDDRR